LIALPRSIAKSKGCFSLIFDYSQSEDARADLCIVDLSRNGDRCVLVIGA
jgi:hypothetical protein